MNKETIGQRIRALRRSKKLTQAQLAKIAGVSSPAVTEWEKDGYSPKAASLESMANYFGVTTEYLLTGKEPNVVNNFNMQEFINKHGLSGKGDVSFDVGDVHKPTVVEQEFDDGFIWIDVVEANFSCGVGESIEFHFDVINGKFPFTPSFFQRKFIDPKHMRIIKAKGDSMSDFIHDEDLVGIDISQTEIIDGEIYAVYFEGEGMIKQIFKEEGGRLTLHSLNPKYRDREVTEQNGTNFKVMGRQFWRAG